VRREGKGREEKGMDGGSSGIERLRMRGARILIKVKARKQSGIVQERRKEAPAGGQLPQIPLLRQASTCNYNGNCNTLT
jgi:hypothetical protein